MDELKAKLRDLLENISTDVLKKDINHSCEDATDAKILQHNKIEHLL